MVNEYFFPVRRAALQVASVASDKLTFPSSVYSTDVNDFVVDFEELLLTRSKDSFFISSVEAGNLFYQHSIVKPNDLRRVNLAFMTANGIASVVFAAFVIADLFIHTHSI